MSEERVGGRSQRTKIILTIVGLLCAPVVGAIVSVYIITAFTLLSFGVPMKAYVDMLPSAVSGGFALGAYLGWPTAFLFGWPVHVGLLQRSASKPVHYAGFGALIAALMFLTVMLVIGAFRFILDPSFTQTGFTATMGGAIGGLVFWLIRRPDRDATASAPPPAAAPAHRTHGQAGDT